MCVLVPYSRSPSPSALHLCRCVTAIVITLVIDRSSGQAPTSLPSLETTASVCFWVEHARRRARMAPFTSKLNEKGYDFIHKLSHSSPQVILSIVLSLEIECQKRQRVCFDTFITLQFTNRNGIYCNAKV